MEGTKMIKDYPKYKITEDGIVISTAQNKIKELKPQKASQSKKGYLQVRLFNKEYSKGRLQYIHRLVWETFKGDIPEDKEIDHIDGDTHNNNISNLQLVTRRNNMLKWNREAYGKLSMDMVKEIRQYTKQGYSIQEIADKLGKSYTSIYRIVRNKRQTYDYVKGKRHYYLVDWDYDKLV